MEIYLKDRFSDQLDIRVTGEGKFQHISFFQDAATNHQRLGGLNFTSHSSRSQEIQDQGASVFRVWWVFDSRLTDSTFLCGAFI